MKTKNVSNTSTAMNPEAKNGAHQNNLKRKELSLMKRTKKGETTGKLYLKTAI